MSACVVTAYIPLPDHPRPEREYRALYARLKDLPISIMCCEARLEDCWLYKYLHKWRAQVTHSVGDNPKKNSLDYHIIQAQKSEWIAQAAMVNPVSDVFVWIDCGIFHLPGMTDKVVIDFMNRVEDEQSIVIPGCWDRGFTYTDAFPIWRWCGGLIIVPRYYTDRFDIAVKNEYKRWLKLHNHVSWDVNTLARVEEQHPELPLWWYKADHNGTMFSQYQPTGSVQ